MAGTPAPAIKAKASANAGQTALRDAAHRDRRNAIVANTAPATDARVYPAKSIGHATRSAGKAQVQCLFLVQNP
jgi:hypothetical protein